MNASIERLSVILMDTIEHPSASIPKAASSAGAAKATYRFYANPRVTADALRRGIATETTRRCLEEDVVLVVQDTTSLNFTGLQSIPELGPIDSGGLARGVHTAHSLGCDHLGTGHRDLGPAVLGAAPAGPAGSRGERERQVDQWDRCSSRRAVYGGGSPGRCRD